jgi:hypothetical protein
MCRIVVVVVVAAAATATTTTTTTTMPLVVKLFDLMRVVVGADCSCWNL